MDVYIARKNIDKFHALLLIETDDLQRRVLLDLLRLEEEKYAAAVALQKV